MSDYRNATEVILEALAPIAGKRALDIGCGPGALKKPLSEAGAMWHGIDPGIDPTSDSDRGVAEALPYDSAAFDAAIWVNALHHVPVAAMDTALAETARILRPGAPCVVIEPDATGDLSLVLAVIDDETEIRAAAQAAMDGATRTGVLEETRAFRYMRRDSYDGFESFADRLASASPERAALVATQRDALRTAFDRLATVQDGRPGLNQPMSARIFRRPEQEKT